MEPNLTKVGQRIRIRIEEELGVNQSAISERTGYAVSQPFISGLIKGKYDIRRMQPNKRDALLSALGWTPEQFTKETGLDLPGTDAILPKDYVLWPVYPATLLAAKQPLRAVATVAYSKTRFERRHVDPEKVRWAELDCEVQSALEAAIGMRQGDWVGLTNEPTGNLMLAYWPKGEALVVYESGQGKLRLGDSLVDRRNLQSLGFVVAHIW